MRLVLDASVAIKLYVDEVDSAAALAWVDGRPGLAAPDIFLVETVQALLRHRREGRLLPHVLAGAVLELRRNVDVPIGSDSLIEQGLRLAEMLQHRLHDCMYLALADRLACPVPTAEARLVRKVAAARLDIPVRLHTETPG